MSKKRLLPKAARTNQKKEVSRPLHLLEKHGLVNQVKIFLSHLLEVSDAVRYMFVICAHSDSLLFLLAKIVKTSGI
jgi:hypothetical protein